MVFVRKLATKAKKLASRSYYYYYHHIYSPKKLTSFSDSPTFLTPTPPEGFIPVYVGDEEEKKRFLVPMSYLSHPLFKMLLEKASVEYGFDQAGGLSLPFTVAIFHEVVTAIRCQHGQFNLERLVRELGFLARKRD